MEEIWKDIPGYEGLYKVSNYGNVISLEKDWVAGNNCIRHVDTHLLKIYKAKKGYSRVYLCKNGIRKGFSVHRLVAIAFLENPKNKPQVDHILPLSNGGTNAVWNLRWVTNKENANNPLTKQKTHRRHSEETKKKMSDSHKGTITEQCLKAAWKSHQKKVEQYYNGCLVFTFESLTQASEYNGVCITAITNLIKNNGRSRKGYTFKFVD